MENSNSIKPIPQFAPENPRESQLHLRQKNYPTKNCTQNANIMERRRERGGKNLSDFCRK